MDRNQINELLSRIEHDRENGRTHILALAEELIGWMGFQYVENNKPRLLDFQTIKLKEALEPAPITGQEQLYRLTAEEQDIRIRFAVLKKFDKKIIHYLVDNNVGLASYQASMKGIRQIDGREPFVARQPYFLHFITTAQYDRLWIVVNENEQKRILVFRRRLTQTQYNKILPAWQNIAARPKPEIAKLFWKSLDIKEVNIDFYRQIKERFDALVGILKDQTKEMDERTIKPFAVRFIGRYIFCWFLKEKEIIPEKLISSSTIEENKDCYIQKYLQKLFFKTLNTEVTDPARNETITRLDELYSNIPYLNGGLFDQYPEDRLYEETYLNDWLITFVKVLESFDFTVDESSSLYQHVAIDPEMLGRIFENLLASQNPETEKMANQRKAFGAFYTPRPIVDYMVNESLKAYIETQLYPDTTKHTGIAEEPLVEYGGTLFQEMEPRQTIIPLDPVIADGAVKYETTRKKIDQLFAPDCDKNPFDKEETNQLKKVLSEITILDPACGSGAFPMGMMLRLMELRQIIGHGHRNNYDLKEEILSRNIFGVDIMPMAVEIARLRAWLSLVLEADYRPADRKNNFGIASLPNLDFKFVCANSLIDSGYDTFISKLDTTRGYFEAYFELEKEIRELERLRDAYFDPQGDKERKQALQIDFFNVKNRIKERFSDLKDSKNLGITDFLLKVDDWDPFDDTRPSSFFSPAWMFGIKEGFDLVIGNPPYIQLQKDHGILADLYRESGYITFERTGDIYVLFYEHALKSLSPGGHLCFITSNKWMRAGYGQKLRKLLASHNPRLLIDCGPDIFESATVDVNILLIQAAKKSGRLKGVTLTSEAKEANLHNFIKNNLMPLPELSEGAWFIANQAEQNLKKKIEKIGKPLKDWDVRINYGIKTGLNEAFIIDTSTKERICREDPRSPEILKPVLRGRDIKRYGYAWAGLWLINTGFDLDIPKLYPAVYNHLLQFEDNARKRDDQGKKWWNLRACSYYEEFEKENVVWSDIATEPIFTILPGGIYFNNTVYMIVGNYKSYLSAILNSSLIRWYFPKIASSLGEKGQRFFKIFVENMPIPPITNEAKSIIKQIEGLVTKIIYIKQQGFQDSTTEGEKQIDLLVYKLYDLTYEEVKVIDPSFGMDKAAYENMRPL
ncbi:MAG: hypothetical protein FJY10_06135 [Bacteroidetes bacterium]|nr:hypothetical protein [Bacteroidota bacterium]